MLLPKRRRLRRLSRLLLGLVIILLTLDTLTTTLSVSSTPAHRILPTSAQSQGNYTVYVVSVHRNTEEIQRAAWNAAVENLARYLGPQRMFFSAFESGSQDGTKDQLRDLRARLDLLGVEHRIKLGLTVWEQLNELDARPPPDRREEGWIWNSMTGTWDMRRIPYLSRVRNHAMGPLWEMEREGRKFDKVLWLNDVVFDVCTYLLFFLSRLFFFFPFLVWRKGEIVSTKLWHASLPPPPPPSLSLSLKKKEASPL